MPKDRDYSPAARELEAAPGLREAAHRLLLALNAAHELDEDSLQAARVLDLAIDVYDGHTSERRTDR